MEQTYTRAASLAERAEGQADLYRALWGLAMCYLGRAEYGQVFALAERILGLARESGQPPALATAHYMLGTVSVYLGDLVAARQHYADGIAMGDAHPRASDLPDGRDPAITCRAQMGRVLWLLGYPDQAVAVSEAALTLATQSGQPHSIVFALWVDMFLRQFLGEVAATADRADRSLVLAKEHDLPQYRTWAGIVRGWAQAMQGDSDGVTSMQQNLAVYDRIGSTLSRTHFLGMLAEALGKHSRVDEALAVVTDALADVERYSERYYEAALYRIRGELLLQLPGASPADAESAFSASIVCARRQEAKAFELSAATSLARLWRDHRRDDAVAILSEAYSWFTEGHDTTDLVHSAAAARRAGLTGRSRRDRTATGCSTPTRRSAREGPNPVRPMNIVPARCRDGAPAAILLRNEGGPHGEGPKATEAEVDHGREHLARRTRRALTPCRVPCRARSRRRAACSCRSSPGCRIPTAGDAAGKPLAERVFVAWEPGIADGPTSSRFAVVDYDGDTDTLRPPAGWDEDAQAFVGTGGKTLDKKATGEFQFHQVSVWALLQRALAFFEDGLSAGARVPWAFEGNRLIVVPHAGYAENAYYDRASKSLQFYYFGDTEDDRLHLSLCRHRAPRVRARRARRRPAAAATRASRPRPVPSTSSSVTSPRSCWRCRTGRCASTLPRHRRASSPGHHAVLCGGGVRPSGVGPAVPAQRRQRRKLGAMEGDTSVHDLSEVLTGAMFDVLKSSASRYTSRSGTPGHAPSRRSGSPRIGCCAWPSSRSTCCHLRRSASVTTRWPCAAPSSCSSRSTPTATTTC